MPIPETVPEIVPARAQRDLAQASQNQGQMLDVAGNSRLSARLPILGDRREVGEQQGDLPLLSAHREPTAPRDRAGRQALVEPESEYFA